MTRRRKRLLLIALALLLGGAATAWYLLRGGPVPALSTGEAHEALLFDAATQAVARGETPYCKRGDDGAYLTAPRVDAGRADDHFWAEGGGCIPRPIDEVWAVLLNHDLMTWKQITRAEVSHPDAAPDGLTHFYLQRCIVERFITVDWILTWSHALRAGTVDAPRQVVVNFQKTAGSGNVPYWEGSILLESLAPGWTAVTFRNQVETPFTTADDAADAVRHVFTKLRDGAPDHTAFTAGLRAALDAPNPPGAAPAP